MTMPDAGSGGTGTREQIRQVRDQVVDQAKTTLREARDRAGSSLADGRRQAADQIGNIAGAFHRTGEHLRNEQQERIAGLADSFAGQVDAREDAALAEFDLVLEVGAGASNIESADWALATRSTMPPSISSRNRTE